MKTQLFGLFGAALMLAVSAPVAVSAESEAFPYTKTGKSADGSYDWMTFLDLDMGEISFAGAETDGGNYSCTWDSVQNCFFFKGRTISQPDITYKELGQVRCDYSIEYSASNVSYYGIFGRMEGMMDNGISKRLVEFYIIDGYSTTTPKGQPLGTVVDNGYTYDIYCLCTTWAEWSTPSEYRYEYYSVIREDDNPVKEGTASVSHTIDIAKHFKAWDDAGIDMECTVNDISFFVEGWQSTGEAKIVQTISGDELFSSSLVAAAGTAEIGDVNGDGTVSISDAVLLQKWLLAEPDAQLPDWKSADLDGDGLLSAADLSLLKKRIAAENG